MFDSPLPHISIDGSFAHLTLPRHTLPNVKTDIDRFRVKPILKWTGGKQWLAPILPEIIPDRWNGTLYEPFLGGGSAYFRLEPNVGILSDKNVDLMTLYRVVRDSVEDLITNLSKYNGDSEEFYLVRSQRPKSDLDIASRFLYLNKVAFNGMYRVNKLGAFNVPYGRYVNPTICDEKRLRCASKLLQNSQIREGDFATTLADADTGDLVYLDPPYITGHTNNGFIKYNDHLFSWQDQLRLSVVAKKLAKHGTFVLVSQAPFKPAVSLYRGFYCYEVTRNSLIGGGSDYRRRVKEVLLSSFPIFGLDTRRI